MNITTLETEEQALKRLLTHKNVYRLFRRYGAVDCTMCVHLLRTAEGRYYVRATKSAEEKFPVVEGTKRIRSIRLVLW